MNVFEKENIMTEEKNPNEVMQFPMDFPVKVMGLNEADFPDTVANIARTIFPNFDNSKTKIALSSNKKYISVNIVVHAESRAQLDDLYRAITSYPKVKVAL